MKERYATFSSLILNLNRYIQKLKDSEMKDIGLKGNQVQCLYYLYNQPDGLSAKQLSEYCEEDKAAISRTIKALEDKELIETKTEEKVYKNPYTLTKKGKNLGKYVVEKIEGFVKRASAGISEASRKILYSSLNLICNNLKKFTEKKEA